MEGVFSNHPTTIDVPLPALPVPYEHVIHLSLERLLGVKSPELKVLV
jgi:hypothetical protein